MQPQTSLILIACCLLATGCSPSAGLQTGSRPAWSLPSAQAEVEREGSFQRVPARQQLASPAQIGRNQASQFYNGRPPAALPEATLILEGGQRRDSSDWFQCVEPSRELFLSFANQYNRSFEGGSDEIDRFKSFTNTLRRTILLNRIIQNEISNETNYEIKKEIRNYHFISPIQHQTNLALWYADITDCELGLMKEIIFDIFYLIDQNDLPGAYRKALDNANYLPLLNDDGFEQLANILLLKLYDRFKGDQKMNQLFQWPLYLKKLAAFAYNRRQHNQPDFKLKLALVKFAYPTYFKDLKYNLPAANRTRDNLHVHEQHENFNRLHNRKISNLEERNRRLAIFRQRLSYLETLAEKPDRWQNVTFAPEWLRPIWADGRVGGATSAGNQRSENLREGSFASQQADLGYKLSQFSDLTDEEFVAYLSNDYSLLANRKDSANFLESNFPIRPLDDAFRAELAHELELRRAILDSPAATGEQEQNSQTQTRRSLTLARRVVDELISDVGLPVGSVTDRTISEAEHFSMFQRMTAFFEKSYATPAGNQRARLLQLAPGELPVSSSDLLDERQRRYEQFKLNHGRFRAWFVKEDWQLDGDQMLTMLKLADMSWLEIKLSLFRVCCLTEETFSLLAQTNATIAYLGSNQFLCQQMGNDLPETTHNHQPQVQTQTQTQTQNGQQQELAALQLYYYYCVHFNKHHNDVDSFNRRFAVFRHNIDHIRRHSCTRGLSLYTSLRLRLPDTFSSVDELDPRRSHTDDLNLDRFRYFWVANLSEFGDAGYSRLVGNERSGNQHNNNAGPDDDFYTFTARDESSGLRSRAGISYAGGSFFNSVSQQGRASDAKQTTAPTYADRLLEAARNGHSSSLKYRQNSVDRIYELVLQRYRHCLRAVGASSSLANNARLQNCSPSGDLIEGGPTWNDQSLAYNLPVAKLADQDQCAFYRLGLKPWAEGLTKQDSISPLLIKQARC